MQDMQKNLTFQSSQMSRITRSVYELVKVKVGIYTGGHPAANSFLYLQNCWQLCQICLYSSVDTINPRNILAGVMKRGNIFTKPSPEAIFMEDYLFFD